MNGTQISDTQRNNRTALTGHTIEALIVVVFYACRFIRGERSLGYFLVITALALIPVILGQFFFFKDRETGMIKPETLVTEFSDPEDVKIFEGPRKRTFMCLSYR